MRVKKIDYIKYTIKHKQFFYKIEKEILGKNTIRAFFHDLDKILLYLILPVKKVSKIHRKYSRHHFNDKNKTENDYIEMIIDWECARYTKKDKPLNAKETLYKFYSDKEEFILPLLKKLNLDS